MKVFINNYEIDLTNELLDLYCEYIETNKKSKAIVLEELHLVDEIIRENTWVNLECDFAEVEVNMKPPGMTSIQQVLFMGLLYLKTKDKYPEVTPKEPSPLQIINRKAAELGRTILLKMYENVESVPADLVDFLKTADGIQIRKHIMPFDQVLSHALVEKNMIEITGDEVVILKSTKPIN